MRTQIVVSVRLIVNERNQADRFPVIIDAKCAPRRATLYRVLKVRPLRGLLNRQVNVPIVR